MAPAAPPCILVGPCRPSRTSPSAT
jgi:hypothetical protein